MPGSPNMEMFIEELITLCGAEHVVVAQSSDASHCTSGVRRDVPATVYPASKDDVVKILSLANRHVVPLHPVSTGRNWGYGGNSPVADEAVILNLSRLTRILGYDPVLGVVTIEPGVTQGQLSQFLIEQGDKFALGNLAVDVTENRRVAVAFMQALDTQITHDLSLFRRLAAQVISSTNMK